jgi:hypothetical protein
VQISPPEAKGEKLTRGSAEWVRWFNPVRRRADGRPRIEGARRRLLLLPERNAVQLGGLVARLDALAADAQSSQIR